MKNKNSFIVTLNSWRSNADHSDIASKADLNAWLGLLEKFSKREYLLDADTHVSINIDWTEAINRAQELKDVYEKGDTEANNYFSGIDLETYQKIICPGTIQIEKPEDFVAHPWQGSDFLKYYLYECFIIMNLSSPGSFNLLYSNFQMENKGNNKFDDLFKHNLFCTEMFFEYALLNSLRYKWPAIEFLDIQNVLSWYMKLDINLKQVTNQRVEKTK